MARDCDALSDNAREIFDKLTSLYGLDPWDHPRWSAEGKVQDNGWFDLRKSADRERLQKQLKSMLGFFIESDARIYREKHGSLQGFDLEQYGKSYLTYVEALLLLNDLDFQIETMDLVEE